MSFNPYEILNNLRRNSNKEPLQLKAFEVSKEDNSLSSLDFSMSKKPQVTLTTDHDRSRGNEQPFLVLSENQGTQRRNSTAVSTTAKNSLNNSLLKDKENNYNAETAIRLYKNKLVQEIPELIAKEAYEEESTIINDKSVNNLSVLEAAGNSNEGKSPIERLQHEFNQLKRNLKNELHHIEMSNRKFHESHSKEERRKMNQSVEKEPRVLQLSSNKVNEDKNTSFVSKQSLQQQTLKTTNREKPGSLRLEPFIYLRDNYPEFPQSIIKVDLRELKEY